MTQITEQRPMELLKSAAPELEALMSLNAKPGIDVKTLVLQELEYLRMHAITKPEIMECMPQTVLMAIKSVIKKNLTLDQSAGLVYVKTRNVKTKNAQGGDVWLKALEIIDSCNGILSINYQCGKIIDHKIPTIKKDDTGKVLTVQFEYQVASGRWETREFDDSDFYRWRRASHKENGRNKQDANLESLNYANENYTNWKGGIDPEFARAKAIRHALKKLGTNPNEGKFVSIVIPEQKRVVIEESKDNESSTDEAGYTDIISETKTETGLKPNNEFIGKL